MDLATVKAKVKAWEKGFRATHSRDPTKSDIKADPGGIGACGVRDTVSTNL